MALSQLSVIFDYRRTEKVNCKGVALLLEKKAVEIEIAEAIK